MSYAASFEHYTPRHEFVMSQYMSQYPPTNITNGGGENVPRRNECSDD